MGNRFKCTLAHGGSGGAEGNTLIVTCDPDFAGVTISASKSGTTYTQTCPSIAPYTVTFHGLDAGTWDISATVSGDTYSTSVTITDFTALLSYGFNWATWVTLGGLDPTDYSDLSDVFADEAAVRRLMLIHASADYLISAVTDDVDVIDAFTANDIAMKWLGLCDYVCDGLTAITGVETKLLASTYWERYLKDHVPVMTGNTSPYGEAIATSFYSTNEEYKAFDNNGSTRWNNSNWAENEYIGYKFTNPVCCKKVSFVPYYYNSSCHLKNFKVQASNTGNSDDWHDLTNIITLDNQEYASGYTIDLSSNDDYYKYYIIRCIDSWLSANTHAYSLWSLQFYGRALNVSVPVMTSNTLPYGEAVSDSALTGVQSAYTAFDKVLTSTSTSYGPSINNNQLSGYAGYKWPSKTRLNGNVVFYVTRQASAFAFTAKVQGSNDNGVTWEDVSDAENFTTVSGSVSRHEIPITTNKVFKQHQILFEANSYFSIQGQYAFHIVEIEFYGVDYSEKEFEAGSSKKWIYDHGVVLEPISAAITTGGTITFGDDYVSFNRNAGANLSIATDSAIDFSSYNYLFTVIDTTGGSGHALIGYATSRTSSESSMTGKKTITAVGSDVKDGLDVSAVNTSEYPIVNATNTGTFNMKELWLAS